MDYRQAAKDFALYMEASEQWARAAQRLQGPARAEALRKAMVYEGNARQIQHAAGDLLKAFPIKKRIKWKGMDISIENPAGSWRKWKDVGTGAKGQTYMVWDYGYLRATEASDGDAVDVFVGPDPDGAANVYVVRQLRAPDFRFYDEDKCMIGFANISSARYAYQTHYDDGRFYGGIDTFPVGVFLQAVKDTKKAPGPVGGWNTLMVPQRMEDSPLVSESMSAVIEAGMGDEIEEAPPLSAYTAYFGGRQAQTPDGGVLLQDGSNPYSYPTAGEVLRFG